MLVAAILATALGSGPAPDPLAPRTRAEAEALCVAFEPPKREFAACVRSMLRDNPQRRAYGDAYPWARQLIEPQGWIVRAAVADQVNLTKAGGGPDWAPRAWLRTENHELTDDAPFLSAVRLYEFDCLGERMRMLQETLYAANNLQGAAQTTTVDMPKWEFATPGSIGDQLMAELCAPLRSASR